MDPTTRGVHMLLRKVAVVSMMLALIAAACGDDSGDSADVAVDTSTTSLDDVAASTTTVSKDEVASTTTDPPALTASWPGVTADTIRIGVLDVDYAQLSALGLFESDNGDARVVIEALVDDLNARGGILGRQVEPFVEIYLPISAVEADATCLRLTEDNDVFAVLGAFVGPPESSDGCFTDQGMTIKIGGTPSPDDLERANAPWYVTGFRDDRSQPATIELLDQAGLIVEPVAVVWAAEDSDAAENVVLPELARLGHDVDVTATMLSPVGDRVALDSEWATLIERFRVDGINTTILVGSSVALNGSNQLKRQGWDGQILLASYGGVDSLGGTEEVPPEDLEGIVGTKGATSEEAWALDATQNCVAVFEAAHPDVTVKPANQVGEGETDWATPLITHCQTLRLFELIAIAAGPELTHETFVAGAESLGEIELPSIPLASLSPGKIDATDGMRLATFDPTIGDQGGGAPTGDLTRVP